MSLCRRFLDCVNSLREQNVAPHHVRMTLGTFLRLDAELNGALTQTRVKDGVPIERAYDGAIVGKLDGVEIRVVL